MTGIAHSAFLLMLAAVAGAGCSRQEASDADAPAKQSPAAATAGAAKTRLKAGLWRVEGPEFEALAEHGKVYLCIDPASAALIDPPPPADAKCSVDGGTPKPGLYLGTMECRYPDRSVGARVRIDSNDLYFRDVVTRRDGDPDGGGEKLSHFAEWVGPCRQDQQPGHAYTQAYGEDAMHPAELPEALRRAAGGR
ncbi:DUF3617 domain-containing protein [Luteimonas aquatica]|uniref:DUF3617 domain-containing protein n=1 Tax=Luteimonas aquatica TaxID=450364 RepID=UPI001F57DFF9|nr:hypothetical protein [Luteimonas aquatica]